MTLYDAGGMGRRTEFLADRMEGVEIRKPLAGFSCSAPPRAAASNFVPSG
jgi:hypothetical protein